MANKPAQPLSFMDKLSDLVFLYRATESAPSDALGPHAILLLGWMEARDAHLAWFVQRHRAMWPHASIIVVKARTAGLAFASIGRRDAQPAVTALHSVLGTQDTGTEDLSKPRLLVHAFSGGGSSSLYHLYGLCGPHGPPLHITIFDSTPGIWTWSFASNVLLAASGLKDGLAKTLLAVPLAHAAALVSWLTIRLGIAADDQRTWSAAHNDPARNRETRRTYIFSDIDKMVARQTIEAHADQAEAKGFAVWSRALFPGSSHVAHARSDPDRYWRLVRETWTGDEENPGPA